MLALTRNSRLKRHCAASLAGATMVALSGLAANADGSVAPYVLSPTPLILKDGRIAEVSVHMLPFDSKTATLSVQNRAQLIELISPVATDCFLTAQAIGHVKPGPNYDGDTLEAHRLARARADFVQDELTALGFDADSIASVWDWQFLVEESRVTLWVFSMRPGDDCDGKPLRPLSAQIAENTEPAPQKPEPTTPKVAPTPAEPAPVETAAAETEPPAARPVDEPVAPEPPAEQLAEAAVEVPELSTSEKTELAGVEPTELALEDQAPVAEPSPTLSAEEMAVVDDAISEATAVAAVAAPATAAVAGTETVPIGGDELAIAFDVNSSWLPQGAVGDLRSFLERLPQDGRYEIDVTAAVGTGDVKNASPEAAVKYNRWMAERRVARVAEWLQTNATGRTLDMAETYADEDSSREVRVSAKRVR